MTAKQKAAIKKVLIDMEKNTRIRSMDYSVGVLPAQGYITPYLERIVKIMGGQND